MKIESMRQVVQRTTKEIGDRLGDLKRTAAEKTPLELNPSERLVMRTRQLSATSVRPSKSEQERILGSNDLVDLNFLERGLHAARSVCRVVLRDPSKRQIGVASGFLVSPRLLLTNHHVFPKAEEAEFALAQFDYALDSRGVERRGPSFSIKPGIYFDTHDALDFALVALDEFSEEGDGSLSVYRPLRLNPQLGKINEGEFISIIQHPSGLPKQVALRENKLLKIDEDYLVYASDTAQGSSGSPLFNDSWQVIGLHSAGVPRKDDAGRWYTRGGGLATDDTDDSDIDWIGNRGARASRIVAALAGLRGHALLDELIDLCVHGADETAPGEPGAGIGADAAATQGAVVSLKVTTAVGGGARVELPAGFQATLAAAGSGVTIRERQPTARHDAVASEAYKQPFVDRDYSSRTGYDEAFLNERVELPVVSRPSIAARMSDGKHVISYEHFSIVMHKRRRLALFTACNVDASPAAKAPDPNRKYTRSALSGLGKNDVEKWVDEPRIGAEHQLPDRFFKNDRKSFDKGHIVRREDVTFGDTFAQVRRANGDTYHVTNCSPQVAAFNQSSKQGDWGLLENLILRQAKTERLSIFAGPVFDDEKDKEFVGEDEDGSELVVQIPSKFWKIVVAEGANGVESFGFVLEQDLRSVVWEFAVPSAWQESMWPIADIAAAIEPVRLPRTVLGADQYDKLRSRESLRPLGAMRRKRR
jgi:endonuclease G